MTVHTPSNPESSPDFTPVPLKYYRHDGWTPERQRDFIAALAQCGSVPNAARSIGMGTARIYELRHRPGAEEFSAAWDDAIAKATNQIHDVLVDHAVNGAAEPIMFAGEQVGEFRRYNYRMMMWLLRHHKPEQFNLSPDGSSFGTPALSDPQMKTLKKQWIEEARAEWEAERATQIAKAKVQMEEQFAEQAKKRADQQAEFQDKIDALRTRMIATYVRGNPETEQSPERFDPEGASVMELLVYDEISGDGPDGGGPDGDGVNSDNPGHALRKHMGFAPRSEERGTEDDADG